VNNLKPEHSALFHARILGKIVIGSITDDFYTTLQNYTGNEATCDGPLLLWLILTHFHTSTVTYQEKIKHDIHIRSIKRDHKDDIKSYLIWLHHQLDILRTTTSNPEDMNQDLMDPIFRQLLSTKSQRLCRIIEDWHL
jgi:hypothetical protein